MNAPLKSSYHVLIEAEDKPRGAGLVFHGQALACAAAAHMAAERHCTVRVVENCLGGAHHTRAVEVARYRPPEGDEEGGQLVEPTPDPHIRREPSRGAFWAALLLAGSLTACDMPAQIGTNLIGQAVIDGETAVLAAAKRKVQEPGTLPLPPKFVPPPPTETKEQLPEAVPGPRFKFPVRFWLT